mmetsp:Transcript_69117/g.104218  ORF Transcript_69117/g.104218 Transcript_69117/m.104218 type:complete len:203 (-) Transcript_69117:960-1568(-)
MLLEENNSVEAMHQLLLHLHNQATHPRLQNQHLKDLPQLLPLLRVIPLQLQDLQVLQNLLLKGNHIFLNQEVHLLARHPLGAAHQVVLQEVLQEVDQEDVVDHQEVEAALQEVVEHPEEMGHHVALHHLAVRQQQEVLLPFLNQFLLQANLLLLLLLLLHHLLLSSLVQHRKMKLQLQALPREKFKLLMLYLKKTQKIVSKI